MSVNAVFQSIKKKKKKKQITVFHVKKKVAFKEWVKLTKSSSI